MERNLKRIKVCLKFTREAKEDFHAWMDRTYPEVPVNSKHHIDCPCGQCHQEFVKQYLLYLAEQN
jgi:hypothetical protein